MTLALPSINPPLRLITFTTLLTPPTSYNLSSSACKVLFLPFQGIETTVHNSGGRLWIAVPGITVNTHIHLTQQYHFTLHIALPFHCLPWSLQCLIRSLFKIISVHRLVSDTPSPLCFKNPTIIALMSVDTRQSLTCLRYPSRFETVSRTQLSKEHCGDLTRPIDHH